MDNASLNAMHQDRHEAGSYRRIELITGTMRRRRWTIEEKAAIVEESRRPGVNVSDVARRFGVNRGLLQTWRRRAMGEAPVFVPLLSKGRCVLLRVFVLAELRGDEGHPLGDALVCAELRIDAVALSGKLFVFDQEGFAFIPSHQSGDI